MSSCLRSIKPT